MPDRIARLLARVQAREARAISRAISLVEDNDPQAVLLLAGLRQEAVEELLVLGVTGPPGAGKSTLTGQLVSRFRAQGQRVGILAIDPSSPITGGAILGDRVRMMQHALDPEVIVRSMATRGRLGGLCAAAGAAVRIMATGGCRLVIIETVGVGQSEMDIVRLADLTLLVLAPGLGDDIQAMKAGLLEVADLLVVNKADCPGAEALALDLESVTNDRSRVCQTDALTGKGLLELVERITTIDTAQRADGTRHRRRGLAVEREIVDWALELLRPRLAAAVSSRVSQPESPRGLARQLLADLGLSEE